MSNDEDLQGRVDALESTVEQLTAEIRRLHRELLAQGVNVPEMAENPEKLPMSPEGLKALRGKLAARARAAKPVGKGKGSVSSPKVKRRLERQVNKQDENE